MYNKLPVSSLESRAHADLKACAELVARSKSGLKRARLAIERLLAEKLSEHIRAALCLYKYSPETIEIIKQTTKPVTLHTSNGPRKCTQHQKYYDFDCLQCCAVWDHGMKPLIDEERREIEKFGRERTAQEIDNDRRKENN